MNTSIIDHIEKHFGKIDSGYSIQNSQSHIQVVKFHGFPNKQAWTYLTLGLSNHVLRISNEQSVRQELIFTAHDNFDGREISIFLLTFCEYLLLHHNSLLRGQVVGPAETIIKSSSMNSVYSAIPILYEKTLYTFNGSEPPTVFVWLLPIYGSEAAYVGSNGWRKFENLLDTQNLDLLDLKRVALI